LSLWCSPANTPASHAGDHRSEAGQGRQSSIALKALSAMHSLGKRISSVQLRVRDPVFSGRAQAPQSSQRSSGFHKPAVSGAAPETARHWHAGHLASKQQPADFFCKEILPEHHRLEAPVMALRKQLASSNRRERLHAAIDVKNVASAGATPAASTILTESKPQKTGTRLLPGYGEVATTSGSTIPVASWCNTQHSGF
jgi:hypothetical protein